MDGMPMPKMRAFRIVCCVAYCQFNGATLLCTFGLLDDLEC